MPHHPRRVEKAKPFADACMPNTAAGCGLDGARLARSA